MNLRKAVGMILLLILVLIGCDHTVLTGEIDVLFEGELHPGQEIPLRLSVPEELEEIHRVMWDVFDQDGNNLYELEMLYEGQELSETKDPDWIKETFGALDEPVDRMALFIPTEPGSYTIEVSGFFRQTNPQPITEIELTVHP